MRTIVMWMRRAEDDDVREFRGEKSSAYHEFFRRISARDEFWIAYDDAHQGNGTFSPVWRYEGGMFMPTDKAVRAETVYNFLSVAPKSEYGDAAVRNAPEFMEFCFAKSKTCDLLGKHMPMTFVVSAESEIERAVQAITTRLVVIKPDRGARGEGVRIMERDEFKVDEDIRSYLSKGALVQEFVDTSAGIPGVCPSTHDLRIVTINNRIVMSHIRIPAPGKLVSNTHQGGSLQEVTGLPEDALAFYRDVHALVSSRFPEQMYTMDIGKTPDGYRLFELNGHTAFPEREFACYEAFIENLIEHLER